MIGFALLVLMLGLAGVVQGGLNRRIMDLWGLPATTLFNSFCFFTAAVLAYVATRSLPETALLGHRPAAFTQVQWWYIIPGFLGFIFVFGVPIGIARGGALALFVGIVASQLLISFLWDSYVEGIPASGLRAVGALLALTGAVIASWKV